MRRSQVDACGGLTHPRPDDFRAALRVLAYLKAAVLERGNAELAGTVDRVADLVEVHAADP